MPERVPCDHPSVETVRATLARAGRTDRPKVALPDEPDRFPADELVHVALGREQCHARIDRAIDDSLEIRGVYATRRQAREADGENKLIAWAEREGIDLGRSVLVDVVEPGFVYGLRKAGTTTVYEVPERPKDSLASIAEDLEGDDD
jgi:hypothetical protein